MPFREGLRHSKAGLGACQSEGVDFRGEPCASARSISSAPMIRGRMLLGVVGMGSRLHGNDGGGVAWGGGDGFPSSRERRRRVLLTGSRLHGNDGGGCCLGWWGWVPVFTGTTGGDGFPWGWVLHGNDGGGCCLGWWGWVPVFTGTTGGDGFPSSRERRGGMGSRLRGNDGGGMGSRLHGNDGGGVAWGRGDGFPSSRERRRRCCLGWWGWVPVFTGTTEAALLGVVGMGSRLHGNDGGGVAWGGGDGFPPSRERRRGCCLGWWGWVPVFTGTTEGVLLGVVGMGSRLHGNDGVGGWVPAFAGTTGGVLLGVVGMGSRLRGNDGGGAVWGGGDGFPPSRERRRRRCLGWWGWVPVFTGTTEAALLGVVGMGSRLRGNDGGGCCLGWWGWVPAFTGTTERGMGMTGWRDGFPPSRE